jgi:hypothetical protein
MDYINLLKIFECFRCGFIQWRVLSSGFNSFNSTFRTKSLLCLMVYTLVGLCLVEIFFQKKLYLLYDRDNGHCNVITNLKVAKAKMYICKACDMLYDFSHKCDKFCSMLRQPVLKSVEVLRYM